MRITKKIAIAFSVAMLSSVMSVYAESLVPVGCSTKPCEKPAPCEKQKPCDCKKHECPKCFDQASVFNSCEQIQEWKTKYFEKRCQVYTTLGLTQEQRVKAKTVDERFFDEIAPLKICCKQEKEKLKELECQKCSRRAKHEQKQKIKDLKSEIKDKKKQHKKCFEKILNDCQKDTYRRLYKDKHCGC